MYKVPKEVSGFDNALEYVDCCPNQPVPKMTFCTYHCRVPLSLPHTNSINNNKPNTKINH